MTGMTLENAPELWGGVECTLNRVRNRYFDQTDLTGHDSRPGDIDRIADLGLRTLRYPVIWERVETTRSVYDWSWTDDRLERLQEVVAAARHRTAWQARGSAGCRRS